MRSELRLLVVLGLAVTAWLALAPVASAAGSSCGIPAIGTGEGLVGREFDCPARNQTRLTQAVWTLVGTGLVAGGDALLLRSRRPPPPVANQRSYYEDG